MEKPKTYRIKIRGRWFTIRTLRDLDQVKRVWRGLKRRAPITPAEAGKERKMYKYYKIIRERNPHIPAWSVLEYLRGLRGNIHKAFNN